MLKHIVDKYNISYVDLITLFNCFKDKKSFEAINSDLNKIFDNIKSSDDFVSFESSISNILDLIDKYSMADKPLTDKINKEEIKQFILNNPDLTNVYIANKFNVSNMYISRVCKDLGIVKKRGAPKKVKIFTGLDKVTNNKVDKKIKRKYIKLNEKITNEIIIDIKKGLHGSMICSKYNVKKYTVYNIARLEKIKVSFKKEDSDYTIIRNHLNSSLKYYSHTNNKINKKSFIKSIINQYSIPRHKIVTILNSEFKHIDFI